MSRSGSNKCISNCRGALAGSVAKQMKKCAAYFFIEAGEATAQLRFPAGVERKCSATKLLKVMAEKITLQTEVSKSLQCMTLAACFLFFLLVQKETKKTPAKDYCPFAGSSYVDQLYIVISDSVFQCSVLIG